MGSLNIGAGTKFKLGPIPLLMVRTMVFQTIAMSIQKVDMTEPDMTEPDIRRLGQAIETQLKYEMEDMIAGHTKQGTRPMNRLRVGTKKKSQQLKSARFGNMFMVSVNNAGEIFMFKRKAAERKVK